MHSAMDWIMCPQNAYNEVLTPDVIAFGDGALKR